MFWLKIKCLLSDGKKGTNNNRMKPFGKGREYNKNEYFTGDLMSKR